MRRLSVLYVEDNEHLRESVGYLLMDGDREIVTSHDGLDAARLLAERSFDVLLSDVSLPGVSGTDLARQVLVKNPSQWVVLCSGHQLGADVKALGPNVRVLGKPFELDDLDALMREIAESIDGVTPAG